MLKLLICLVFNISCELIELIELINLYRGFLNYIS